MLSRYRTQLNHPLNQNLILQIPTYPPSLLSFPDPNSPSHPSHLTLHPISIIHHPSSTAWYYIRFPSTNSSLTYPSPIPIPKYPSPPPHNPHHLPITYPSPTHHLPLTNHIPLSQPSQTQTQPHQKTKIPYPSQPPKISKRTAFRRTWPFWMLFWIFGFKGCRYRTYHHNRLQKVSCFHFKAGIWPLFFFEADRRRFGMFGFSLFVLFIIWRLVFNTLHHSSPRPLSPCLPPSLSFRPPISTPSPHKSHKPHNHPH